MSVASFNHNKTDLHTSTVSNKTNVTISNLLSNLTVPEHFEFCCHDINSTNVSYTRRFLSKFHLLLTILSRVFLDVMPETSL